MQQDFTLSAYDYTLPEQNIAQHPADKRDNSRLLVLNHRTATLEHKHFSDITHYLHPGDLLVINNTRVFPARLLGQKATGGKAEVFLLGYPTIATDTLDTKYAYATTQALIKSSKRPKVDSVITISDQLCCIVREHLPEGKVRIDLRFLAENDLAELLEAAGQVPLPPYIKRLEGTTAKDRDRYQTVYADEPGAVAAPTAGLHFTDEILNALREKGVQIEQITLHVGYGTFAPVRTEEIRDHQIHQEYVHISEETAATIRATKQAGGKIWAVGTTTVRALEFAVDENDQIQAVQGSCDLYIVPGFRFRVIDNMITNFHLPGSSLLFLVSALCGRQTLLSCYQEAIDKGYRFYSYGDAMLIYNSTD